MLTQKDRIVDILKSYTKMSLEDMEVQLGIDGPTIQTQISGINHDRKKFQTVRIHRTGKKGNSFYEIQDQNTPTHVIYGTMDRKTRTVIKGLGLYRDVSLMAVANAPTQALRAQLVKDLTAHKQAMMQKIAIETM